MTVIAIKKMGNDQNLLRSVTGYAYSTCIL